MRDVMKQEVNKKPSSKMTSKRGLSERDNDNTFAKCSQIIITETFDGDTVSMTLTRTTGQIKWSKTNGAWKNQIGTSYDSPNDAWKDLIENRWDKEGIKKFDGANVWGKTGRMIVTTNSGRQIDIFKNPYNVLLFLDKCHGKYMRGKDFASLTPHDFTQLEYTLLTALVKSYILNCCCNQGNGRTPLKTVFLFFSFIFCRCRQFLGLFFMRIWI